jgi:hypothetical protein
MSGDLENRPACGREGGFCAFLRKGFARESRGMNLTADAPFR